MDGESGDPRPCVRVVVLNWNSAWFTRRCIDALLSTDYPTDRLEVVLVDNGSVDGSLERLHEWFPGVRIVANGANLGFAEGCNRAMRDRGGVDAIALINNDTIVDPGWLSPLVDALERDPSIGAASARLVLEPGFVGVDVVAKHAVSVRSARTDDGDVTAALRYEGFDAVSDAAWPLDITHRLTGGRGRIWVPASPEVRSLRLAFDGAGEVSADLAGTTRTAAAGQVLEFAVASERVVLVNGLGTARNERCEGYDRCYGIPESDLPEASDVVVEVDGVCGGAALFRSTMLDEVGLLDPRLFAYYEDTDLSWRASRAGWRSVAVPSSRVTHAFGAAGGSRATGFFHLDRRNWWLTADRNGTAPERGTVRSEVRREAWTAVRANIAGRLKRRRPPSLQLVVAWARIVADHRLEVRRRAHPSQVLPGVRATNAVVGRFQPEPRPSVPAPRPWGPAPVLVDVTPILDRTGPVPVRDRGRDGGDRESARRLVRSLLMDHPELDVVAVVVGEDGRSVVAGPEQMAELLGVHPVGPAPADRPIDAEVLDGVVLRLSPVGSSIPVAAGAAPDAVVEASSGADPETVAEELSVVRRTAEAARLMGRR